MIPDSLNLKVNTGICTYVCKLFTYEVPRSSKELAQKCPCQGSNLNLYLEILILEEREPRSTQRKTPRSREENQVREDMGGEHIPASQVGTVHGRFDTKSFRYKSKSIRYTRKVDSIQTEVVSIQK